MRLGWERILRQFEPGPDCRAEVARVEGHHPDPVPEVPLYLKRYPFLVPPVSPDEPPVLHVDAVVREVEVEDA